MRIFDTFRYVNIKVLQVLQLLYNFFIVLPIWLKTCKCINFLFLQDQMHELELCTWTIL